MWVGARKVEILVGCLVQTAEINVGEVSKRQIEGRDRTYLVCARSEWVLLLKVEPGSAMVELLCG